MSGIMVSSVAAIITVVISFFIAFIVKVMVVVLEKLPQPKEEIESASIESAALTDETDIAAVIAIANSRK